jgi:hypothetical protein
MAGFRPRLASPMMLAILGRMKDREMGNVLSKLGFRSAEIDTLETFPEKVGAAEKELTGKKTNSPIDAYHFIEKLPMEYMAYMLAESNKSAAVSKLKAYLHKWRPIRIALPAVTNELETLGMRRSSTAEARLQKSARKCCASFPASRKSPRKRRKRRSRRRARRNPLRPQLLRRNRRLAAPNGRPRKSFRLA